MSQKSFSRQNRRLAWWYGESIRRKIIGTFLGTIMLVGLLMIFVVYFFVGRLLHEQIDQRALAIGTNLSDASSGFASTRNFLQLNALVTKYSLLQGVAYASIVDRTGKVLAHSLGSSATELPAYNPDRNVRESWRRKLIFQERPVYEIGVPILGGQAGTVRLGVWGDVVEQEIRGSLLPIIALIGCLLLAGIVISLILSRQIIRPILRLKSVADSMTKGDLETPISIESRDEIGELAHSLERMRTSLRAAMVRLSSA